jgi:hypothetical protein
VAKQKTYPSLDKTGSQAAIYPSEEALWIVGPPINDPGDQGVAPPEGDHDGQPAPPEPTLSPAQEDAWIHEAMNGQTSNAAINETWVNVQQHGPTGFGAWNDGMQVFETGHTQNVVSDPGSEQGWGVGPARRWAHYPHEESPNPYRNSQNYLRNGELPWVTTSSILYYRTQLAWEQQWDPYKARSPVNPVVQVPSSVPYVSTVPTWSGGPVTHPGIDFPIGEEGVAP